MAGGGYDQIFSDFINATGNNSMVMGEAISSANRTVDSSLADALKYLDGSYKEAQAYLTPFRVAGQNSLNTLNNFIGVNGQQAQQQALAGIIQPAMNSMIQYGPQIAQQAMGMFFGQAGFSPQQANQMINQSTAQAIQQTPEYQRIQMQQQIKALQDQKAGLKPESAYQSKISQIQGSIDQMTKAKLSAQEQYNANIARGDELFKSQNEQWYKQNPTTASWQNPLGIKKLSPYDQQKKAGEADYQSQLSTYDKQIEAYKKQLSDANTDLNTKYGGDIQKAMKADPGQYDPAYASAGIDKQIAEYQSKLNDPNFGLSGQGSSGSGSGSISGSLSGSSSGGMFKQYMGQYERLMNTSPESLSNSMISSLMDPVSGAVTKATQGFTDSMMKYGTKAIDQSAASKGMLNSGRTLAELQDYGMGVAGQYVIPAMQNVLGMGMQSGNNLVSGILGQGGNLLGQQTQLAQAYMGQTLGAGAQLAGQSIGATQNALSNLLAQATGAATAGANLKGQQGTTGSGYNMQVGQYKADNALLNGKVQMDALNTMSQLQFIQDMGPYINELGSIPGITSGSGGTPGGGGQANGVAGESNALRAQANSNQGSYSSGWVNPGPQGQLATLPGGGQGWGSYTSYTPASY